MKIILTGSSGRVGRAIFGALTPQHDVVGIDRTPFATTRIIGDFADREILERALDGADAVIHTAAFHAPHVAVVPDREFERVNVEGTQQLAALAKSNGVRRLVFTSTTALYGTAIAPGRCTWVDESLTPQPKSIYHRTKLAAEQLLMDAASPSLQVRAIRMSRCFPEAADLMAVYRLHRGVDVRDVADAHSFALGNEGPAFQRFIVSGATPFKPADCEGLAVDARAILGERVPNLVRAFEQRGWRLPTSLDRIYAPTLAERELGWRPRHGFEEVLAQVDRRSLEVLPGGVGLTKIPE
jgi:nucleoside-diphosphate-sugar epimerase